VYMYSIFKRICTYSDVFHFSTLELWVVDQRVNTVNHKKRDILFLTITLANLTQFL